MDFTLFQMSRKILNNAIPEILLSILRRVFDYLFVPRAHLLSVGIRHHSAGRWYSQRTCKMVLVEDGRDNVDSMDRQRKKPKDLNHYHQNKANLTGFKSREGKEIPQRKADDKTSHRGLIDKLHNLDITLSRNLSFCADKASGRWRTLMIILEISGHGVPWIAGAVIFILLFSDLKQEFACNLLLALMLDLAVVGALKVAVRRKRPVYNEKDMFATVSVDNYSFPSGHSTRAAMVAGLLSAFLSYGVWRILIGFWALCVSASRVVLGRHHVSDVLCGVAIGLLQAWTVYAMWLPTDTCQELLTLVPYFGELRHRVAVL